MKEEIVKTKVKTKEKKARRVVGPGTKKFSFKEARVRGACDVARCSKKARSPKGFRCKKHIKLVRKAQLKANNVVWRKRVKAQTAGHHIVYTFKKVTKPTEWATRNPDAAVTQTERGATVDTKALRQLLKEFKPQPKAVKPPKPVKVAKPKPVKVPRPPKAPKPKPAKKERVTKEAKKFVSKSRELRLVAKVA